MASKMSGLVKKHIAITNRFTNQNISEFVIADREKYLQTNIKIKHEYESLIRNVKNNKLLKINIRSKTFGTLFLESLQHRLNAVNLLIDALQNFGYVDKELFKEHNLKAQKSENQLGAYLKGESLGKY